MKECIIPCVQLLKLVYATDKAIGLVIFLCLLLDTVQEVPYVWVEAQTHTCLQQFLMQSAPKQIVLPRLIKLLIAKSVFVFISMRLERVHKRLEAKIKKRLRIKLTIKLLKSFYNLDFETQSDPLVIEEFQSASKLYGSSILRITNQIFDMLKSAAKIISLLVALLMQFRNKEQISLFPIIVTVVGIEAFIIPSTSRSCCLTI